MIDEFQDINRAQYECVRLLGGTGYNVFVVGDDDQSIYRFRGSRPDFLLNFPKDFPGTKSITLATNYRSTDEIITYANAVINQNTLRYQKDIHGTGSTGTRPRIITSDDQNMEAVNIATRVKDAITRGTPPDEISVAYRLNMQARALADAFLDMNIPFKTRDEMPTLYDHWMAQDFFAYLRAAARVGRIKTHDEDIARIINRPFRFIPKAFAEWLRKENAYIFAAYRRSPLLHTAVKTRIEELHDELISLSKKSPEAAIRYICLQMGYNGHIIDTCEHKRLKPAGLLEVASELQEAAKQFNSAQRFIAHAATVAAFQRENRDSAQPCVTLTTMHSAKGLEFSHVYIAGAVDCVIPSQHCTTAEEYEEERRLFYVGITRAKHHLTISTLRTRYDKPTKPSRFIVT
jgi:DNA helicase-2/ATP-dependent DNA helicase PcrA